MIRKKPDQIYFEVYLYGYGYSPDLSESLRGDLCQNEIRAMVRGERMSAFAPCISIDIVVNVLDALKEATLDSLVNFAVAKTLQSLGKHIKERFTEGQSEPRIASLNIRQDASDIVFYGNPLDIDLSRQITKINSFLRSSPIRDGRIESVSFPTMYCPDGVYRCGRVVGNGSIDLWTVRYLKNTDYFLTVYDSANDIFLEDASVEIDRSKA